MWKTVDELWKEMTSQIYTHLSPGLSTKKRLLKSLYVS